MYSLLLTRSADQSARFAADIAARFGPALPILISPLLALGDIALAKDPMQFDGLIFTSENGVAAFTRQISARHWPVWCVGPRTADAARQAGFPVRQADGDAAALIRDFRGQGRWLHLRGEHATGAVASSLTAAGTDTEEAVIYQQRAQPLSAQARQLLARPGDVLLPLFSPRTARIFAAEAPEPAARLWVAALSPAVAAAAAFPHSALQIARHPTSESMLDAIASFVQPQGAA